MAIKNIVAKGIGFTSDGTIWIPTHGFALVVVNHVSATWRPPAREIIVRPPAREIIVRPPDASNR